MRGFQGRAKRPTYGRRGHDNATRPLRRRQPQPTPVTTRVINTHRAFLPDRGRTGDTPTKKQREPREQPPMVQGWTQVDMVAFANPTLEKLNRIQVLPNTRKGRRAILETAEGIGHCPIRPREKHPHQDNKEQQDEEWFARFTDDYDGANPMFLMYIQDQPLRCLLDTGASVNLCLLYTSPSPRDLSTSRMPSSA